MLNLTYFVILQYDTSAAEGIRVKKRCDEDSCEEQAERDTSVESQSEPSPAITQDDSEAISGCSVDKVVVTKPGLPVSPTCSRMVESSGSKDPESGSIDPYTQVHRDNSHESQNSDCGSQCSSQQSQNENLGSEKIKIHPPFAHIPDIIEKREHSENSPRLSHQDKQPTWLPKIIQNTSEVSSGHGTSVSSTDSRVGFSDNEPIGDIKKPEDDPYGKSVFVPEKTKVKSSEEMLPICCKQDMPNKDINNLTETLNTSSQTSLNETSAQANSDSSVDACFTPMLIAMENGKILLTDSTDTAPTSPDEAAPNDSSTYYDDILLNSSCNSKEVTQLQSEDDSLTASTSHGSLPVLDVPPNIVPNMHDNQPDVVLNGIDIDNDTGSECEWEEGSDNVVPLVIKCSDVEDNTATSNMHNSHSINTDIKQVPNDDYDDDSLFGSGQNSNYATAIPDNLCENDLVSSNSETTLLPVSADKLPSVLPQCIDGSVNRTKGRQTLCGANHNNKYNHCGPKHQSQSDIQMTGLQSFDSQDDQDSATDV